jgi:hypothetical protein
MTYQIERNGTVIEADATLPYRDFIGDNVQGTYRIKNNDGPDVWSEPATATSQAGPTNPTWTADLSSVSAFQTSLEVEVIDGSEGTFATLTSPDASTIRLRYASGQRIALKTRSRLQPGESGNTSGNDLGLVRAREAIMRTQLRLLPGFDLAQNNKVVGGFAGSPESDGPWDEASGGNTQAPDRWSSRIQCTQWSGGPKWSFYTYAYLMDGVLLANSNTGGWGHVVLARDGSNNMIPVNVGQTYDIEMHLRVQSAPTVEDGYLKFYLDGLLVADVTARWSEQLIPISRLMIENSANSPGVSANSDMDVTELSIEIIEAFS